MRQSMLFTKTERVPPSDEPSSNARLLQQAGFIDKLAAGIYSYCPLGLRVLQAIQQIVREEMRSLGAQEILMPALHPKQPWAVTGRWQDPGPAVMFQWEDPDGHAFGLGWTHEEIVTPLAKRFIHSYRDLPFSVFQIQDKFRNEPRAKSGLLRGREFSMKDLYSFHHDALELDKFYDQTIQAYQRVFKRCGLNAVLTEASGGPFSKYSHEFQVVTPHGEDVIVMCTKCSYAQNREIATGSAATTCTKCGGKMQERKAIEVGNIFKLGTRYADAFKVTYVDERGKSQPVWMGCYGIGPSRVMGAIAEVHQDAKGLRWPPSVAPYQVHLLVLGQELPVRKTADAVYEKLQLANVAVLYDDRPQSSAGEKFNDADLLGLPWRAVVSEKTGGKVELRERSVTTTELVTVAALIARVQLSTSHV